jgi:hypothetical protein
MRRFNARSASLWVLPSPSCRSATIRHQHRCCGQDDPLTTQASAVNEAPGLIREDLEVGRLSAELADRFRAVPPEVIEHSVREEFVRWSTVPVQDFVPIFVARAAGEAARADRLKGGETG